jgi:uncharacterized protein YkwD
MARWTRYIALLSLAVAAMVTPAVASAADPYAGLLAPESACPGQDDASLPEATQVNAMVCMQRWARHQEHLSGLQISKKLRTSSTHKARDIRRCGQFSHYACGRNAFYWEQRAGFFRGTYGAGENLALTYGADTTVRGAMDLWLNSAEHRRVMLTPSYRELGVTLVTGAFDGNDGAHIWVAQFGYNH